MHWTDRYMAVPHKDHGRGFNGADCAGLYALIVAHETGESIDLPDCKGDPMRAARLIEAAIISGSWRKIDGEPKRVARRFDAILMRGYTTDADGATHRADIHIGCATGEGTVIHTGEAFGRPRNDPLDCFEIARRIQTPVHGVYRPAFLERE